MSSSQRDLDIVRELLGRGLSIDDAAARAGVPVDTIRTWVLDGLELLVEVNANPHGIDEFCRCVRDVPEEVYSYLLGLYLGDGNIVRRRNGVYRLRIFQDDKYPSLIRECMIAMHWVGRNKVAVYQHPGCKEVCSLSKHWPCLFPQHGPGMKHERSILLEPWQRLVAIERHPEWLLRGLIHSDGCRYVQRPKRRGKDYVYVRYQFANRSADIRRIFMDACDRAGIECTENHDKVSIGRRSSVQKMDRFIGPKC